MPPLIVIKTNYYNEKAHKTTMLPTVLCAEAYFCRKTVFFCNSRQECVGMVVGVLFVKLS